jgi:hypothetical protein
VDALPHPLPVNARELVEGDMGSRSDVRLRLTVCGLLLGAAGLLLFGTVHAIVIVPIWNRLVRGGLFAVIVGLLVTWTYHEYRQVRSSPQGAGAGVRFGALLWLAGLPAMVLGFGMRLKSTPGPVHWLVDVATVGLAALGGAALLWSLTRTRRGALAGGFALGVLLAYNGGPMPIEVRSRALGLPVGYLMIEAIGGALLALLYARVVAPFLPTAAPTDPAEGKLGSAT